MVERRWSVLAVLVLALLFAAPATGDGIEDKKASVDQRIEALESEIAAASDQEGVLTSQLSALATELRAAQSAVDEAQESLDRLEVDLAAEQERLGRLTARLHVQTLHLHRLQEEHRRALAVLEARVREIYVEETPDVLSLLVSASSFSDLIDDFEFLSRIGLQDERIARDVAEAKAKAAAERRATIQTRTLAKATVSVISARTEEARTVRDELAASRDSLTRARRLKESALTDARETREDYLAEVEALAAQSAALAAAIREAQRGSGSTGTGVSSSGLIWPVDGPVVSGFGMRWGRMHEGIDIAVPTGTQVRASADGTVIHSGWLGGYGLLVVVDHGNGLATAYAHNSVLLVAVGQRVAQGQTLSLSGSTGHSSGPHVHFEVRVNGIAVDPLLYLA